MKVIELLKEENFARLEELAIRVKDYGKFWLLNYDQINSPKHDDVVKECRGLIVSKDFKVLCRSFDRFFNYLEDKDSSNFNICDAEVLEKVDGSLVRFWWNPFDYKWCISTRKMAFAEGETAVGLTFFQLISEVLSPEAFGSFEFSERYTYIFEFVSSATRIVTRYPESALYLLAIRDNESGKYQSNDMLSYVAGSLNVKLPKRYTFRTIDECLSSLKELPALEEGYVANSNGWRIKIKSPSYLAIAHLRNNGVLSVERIAKLCWMNDHEEYLAVFPEDKQYFDPWIKAVQAFKEQAVDFYNKNCDIVSQKDFAMVVKDTPYSHLCFLARKKQVNIETLFEEIEVNDSFICNLRKCMV